jgi:hypothetical protein
MPAPPAPRKRTINRLVILAIAVLSVGVLGLVGTVRSSAKRGADERRALAINLPVLREKVDDLAARLEALDRAPSGVWSRDDLISAGMDVPSTDTEARWPSLAHPIQRLRTAVEALSALPRDPSEARRWRADELTRRKAELVSKCRSAVGAYRTSLSELAKEAGLP